MKALVIYDSAYGNTESIAKTICVALGEDARVLQAAEADPASLVDCDLLVVGSPTQAGRATKPVTVLLKAVPRHALSGTQVAAFDTRIDSRAKSGIMRAFMGLLGYAAPRIMRQLKSKGGMPTADPEGFFVQDTKGPLADGEAQRAAEWAASLTSARAAAS